MKNNKGNLPTRELTLERQRRAFDMRLKGCTQRTIATELGITQGAVSQMLIKLNNQYATSLHKKHGNIRNDHVARIEAMKEELYRAWDASPKGPEDIKIVEQIRKLDADIRKMQGADAPTRTVNTDVDVSRLSDDELRTIINIKS